jgi:hypothetical protein
VPEKPIRCILENHVYIMRLYWNRLDFRQSKLGAWYPIKTPHLQYFS